jgi:hypothetical protein
MEAQRADPDSASVLKAFLRARRQRLRPEDLGLPSRHTRGTGLRREDVAELLEVSPLWYALFESGTSGRRFSGTFLERLQDVLCLDPNDRLAFIELVVISGHANPEVEARWHRSRNQSVLHDIAVALARIDGTPNFETALALARSSLRAILVDLGAGRTDDHPRFDNQQ